jgi:CRP-like cAMP-binding protein
VKKLLDRLKSGTRADAEPDEGLFTSQFAEHENGSPVANWATRAQDVRAEPFDRGQGAAMLAQLWSADRNAVKLDAAELERLAGYFEFAQLPSGQQVIGQDEQGDYMLVVLEGRIAVDRLQPWGSRARLAEARAGDMLGEMSLIDAGARFSACSTLTPCLIAVIDARHLDQLIRHEPRLALALLASLSRRLSLRLRQVSARLSALLSRE